MKNSFKHAFVFLCAGLALAACSKSDQSQKSAQPPVPALQTAKSEANISLIRVEVYYDAKAEKHATKILNKLVRAGLNASEGGALGTIFEKNRLKERMNTFAVNRTCDPMVVEKVWAAVNDGTMKKKEYDFAWLDVEQRKHVILIALIN